MRIVYLDGENIGSPIDASFNGLVFSCQWNETNLYKPTYAWKMFYREVWKIERADVEKMVKTLRKVNRISSQASPASFGQYVALTAKALKINLALRESDHSKPQLGYNFKEYVQVPSSEVAGVIDETVLMVRSFGQATRPELARVAIGEIRANPPPPNSRRPN